MTKPPEFLAAVAIAWPMLVLATFVLLAFWGEMARYDRAKGVISNLGATVLSLVYVGLMLAVIGSLILVCDIWIVLEGLRVLMGTEGELQWTSAT